MSVKFNLQAFSQYISETLNTYYSPPRLNAALATCERFLLEVRTTDAGPNTKITVTCEISNDGVNWGLRSTLLSAATVSGSGVMFAAEPGTTTVCGRYMRLTAKLSGTLTPRGFVEMWVCGRSAA